MSGELWTPSDNAALATTLVALQAATVFPSATSAYETAGWAGGLISINAVTPVVNTFLVTVSHLTSPTALQPPNGLTVGFIGDTVLTLDNRYAPFDEAGSQIPLVVYVPYQGSQVRVSTSAAPANPQPYTVTLQHTNRFAGMPMHTPGSLKVLGSLAGNGTVFLQEYVGRAFLAVTGVPAFAGAKVVDAANANLIYAQAQTPYTAGLAAETGDAQEFALPPRPCNLVLGIAGGSTGTAIVYSAPPT